MRKFRNCAASFQLQRAGLIQQVHRIYEHSPLTFQATDDFFYFQSARPPARAPEAFLWEKAVHFPIKKNPLNQNTIIKLSSADWRFLCFHIFYDSTILIAEGSFNFFETFVV